MCGIFFSVSAHAHAELDSRDEARLRNRGPDVLTAYTPIVSHGSRRWFLTFTSSVLSLRGDKIVTQPVVDESTSSVFCWNGEAWSFGGRAVSGNDTALISEQLFRATEAGKDSETVVLDVLSKISGPYAFVFYDAVTSKVYFGRDNLGRRSLILQQDSVDFNELTVSSITTSCLTSQSQEVETLQVFCIDLKHDDITITSIASKKLLPSINKTLPHDGQFVGEKPSIKAVAALLEELRLALQLRVEAIPTYTTYGETEHPSKVAVLFSGGLDCTLLARLIHDILPHDQPVDLLNVAFENPRVIRAGKNNKGKVSTESATDCDVYDDCPDRQTGLASYSELTRICHQRLWRFIRVNVPYAEFIEHKATVIQLMRPHKTEMDLSITSALYFAARGRGISIQSGATSELTAGQYTTTARVLLSGLGADELFGGYGRHAAAFSRGGYAALNEELELDFNRIGTRNLGRDDRVIAHWGRETRYPFLDENLVRFALGLSAWEKCGFRPGKDIAKHFEPSTVSDKIEDLPQEKMLLRCALWELGMKRAAMEKKRAIQFGARTAKMESGRTKGTDDITIEKMVG